MTAHLTTTAHKVTHHARYYIPGSFSAEQQTAQLNTRSLTEAVAKAPAYAFAFELYDLPVADFDWDHARFQVSPLPQNKSAKHYLGGTVYTCDALRALARREGDAHKYDTLIANITTWQPDGSTIEGRAIRCRIGNWQPFEDGDVLLEAVLDEEPS